MYNSEKEFKQLNKKLKSNPFIKFYSAMILFSQLPNEITFHK